MISFYKPNYKIVDKDSSYLTIANIKEIIEGGRVTLGKYTLELEEFFKKEFDVKYAIACANATTGLTVVVRATTGTKKYIAVPSFTWPSTIYAVQRNHSTPVFCDIDPATWIIEDGKYDCVDLVLAVDTFGNRAFVETDTPVIYDAAHGFGIHDLGNRGLAEVVSLAATKEPSGMQGGMILTNNDEIAEDCRRLVKFYGKLTEINALVCLETVENYSKICYTKEKIIHEYRERIKVPFTEQKPLTDTTLFNVYSILLKDTETRDKIAKAFREKGIEVKIYYKPYVESLPVTDDIYSRIIALPVYKGMGSKVWFICKVINEACK